MLKVFIAVFLSILIILVAPAYAQNQTFPSGQQLNVTEVNINGTTFYSISGNSTTLQLEGKK